MHEEEEEGKVLLLLPPPPKLPAAAEGFEWNAVRRKEGRRTMIAAAAVP